MPDQSPHHSAPQEHVDVSELPKGRWLQLASDAFEVIRYNPVNRAPIFEYRMKVKGETYALAVSVAAHQTPEEALDTLLAAAMNQAGRLGCRPTPKAAQ